MGFFLSDEEYQEFKKMVRRDIVCKECTRDELLVKRYGHCVDPRTGKKFAIPYVDLNNEVEYARKMFMLDTDSDRFERILNWD